ncbi:F-box domain containing protein [Tanacetum coccineum]
MASPDPILELILQGLPTTKEVVRTSILSTRWRYLWTSLPHFPSLNIDCERVLNSSVVFPKKKFKDFVSWCLADKTRDLDSFRLCCATYYNVSTVETLIKAAIMRKVKSLDLMYCPKSENEDTTLPHYVISCDSLEVLRLCLYRRAFHFPESTSLRFRPLRVLGLESVYCNDMDLVEQFIRLCPSLEELTLIDCFVKVLDTTRVSSPKLKTLIIRNCKDMYSECHAFWSNIDVECPELVNFEFVGRRGEILIEKADCLKKAVIFPEVIWERNLSPNLGKIFCELLAGISHVESLSINFYFIQTLEVITSIDAFTMNVLYPLPQMFSKSGMSEFDLSKGQIPWAQWRKAEARYSPLLTGA